MAYSAAKNQLFHERVKNYAVAMQNLREEGDRLREWYIAEVASSPDFVDTDTSTKSEVIAMAGYIDAFRSMNENVAVSASNRRTLLIPFLANVPAN